MLRGKVVVVTGAFSGIGKGIADACHDAGACVVSTDISKLPENHLLSPRISYLAETDVSASSSWSSIANHAISKFGRLDGLVNNAGVNFNKPFLDTTESEFDKVISVDLRAVFFLTQACVRTIQAEASRSSIPASPTADPDAPALPYGFSVVNISSTHAIAAMPGAAPYDAAKSGLVGMTKALAIELADPSILVPAPAAGFNDPPSARVGVVRVNTVSPGLVKTAIWDEMEAVAADVPASHAWWASNIPMGRIMRPSEIAAPVLFLLSDASSAMTGGNIVVDAGMTAQLVSKPSFDAGRLGVGDAERKASSPKP